jgi:hypothetical protein
MDDNNRSDALGRPFAKILDSVFFDATERQLIATLGTARRTVSSFRQEICSLVTEPDLPPAFRDAYGRIVSLLAAVERAIANGENESLDLLTEIYDSNLRLWGDFEPEPAPALVNAAKAIIGRINEAENRLIKAVSAAQSALLTHADHGLIDWNMPYDCEIDVLIDPGPTRRFYETCAEGEEPMRIRLDPVRDFSRDSPTNDPTTNWNIFTRMEGHPLQHGHHGYLVHCILDHSPVPWRLLPYIKEIRVGLIFRDWETLWTTEI